MTGNNYGLKGRRAIVTGASRGLGRVCAEALAREGVDLLLASRSEGDLQRLASTLDSPERHAVYVGDLTREDEISGLVECALRFGDIDIVLQLSDEEEILFESDEIVKYRFVSEPLEELL